MCERDIPPTGGKTPRYTVLWHFYTVVLSATESLSKMGNVHISKNPCRYPWWEVVSYEWQSDLADGSRFRFNKKKNEPPFFLSKSFTSCNHPILHARSACHTKSLQRGILKGKINDLSHSLCFLFSIFWCTCICILVLQLRHLLYLYILRSLGYVCM